MRTPTRAETRVETRTRTPTRTPTRTRTEREGREKEGKVMSIPTGEGWFLQPSWLGEGFVPGGKDGS